jgi:AraC-like DNA-binding protein
MSTEDHPGSWLLDAFEQTGLDNNLLAQRLPHQWQRIRDFPNTISPDELNLVLIECAQQCEDPHFGLHLAEVIDIKDLGLYPYLLYNAPNLAEFLRLAQEYYPIFYRGACIEVESVGDTCRVTYRPADRPTVSQQHDTEWTLGFFVHSIRAIVGANWSPLGATFEESYARTSSELERFFGTHLKFGQQSNSIEIESALLSIPLNESDPDLLRIIRDQADQLLHVFRESDSLESHVRLLIIKNLEHDSQGARQVARELGISLSTFKRILLSYGLSYRRLRDDVIFQLAQQALRDTRVKISLLAMRLGYSEVSAFNHAFLRLAGQSPSAFRSGRISV